MTVYRDLVVDIPKTRVTIEKQKDGKPVKPGTVRGEFNKDGSPRKKPDVKVGTKRSLYNKDGSLRKKPSPKSKQ